MLSLVAEFSKKWELSCQKCALSAFNKLSEFGRYPWFVTAESTTTDKGQVVVQQGKDNRIEIPVLCHDLAIIHIIHRCPVKVFKVETIMALPLGSEERRYIVRFVLGGLFSGCTGWSSTVLWSEKPTGTKILS